MYIIHDFYVFFETIIILIKAKWDNLIIQLKMFRKEFKEHIKVARIKGLVHKKRKCLFSLVTCTLRSERIGLTTINTFYQSSII